MSDDNIDIGGFADEVNEGLAAHAYDQVLAEAKDKIGDAKVWLLFMLTDDDFTELASTGHAPLPLGAWLAFLQESSHRIFTNFVNAVEQMEGRVSEADESE